MAGKVSLLSNYRQWLQQSFFACQVDACQYLRLQGDIKGLIDFEEERVRYSFLCPRCQGNLASSGWGRGARPRTSLLSEGRPRPAKKG